jgi:hypothetical protein
LEDIEPSVEVPIAAYYALKKLRHVPQTELVAEEERGDGPEPEP